MKSNKSNSPKQERNLGKAKQDSAFISLDKTLGFSNNKPVAFPENTQLFQDEIVKILKETGLLRKSNYWIYGPLGEYAKNIIYALELAYKKGRLNILDEVIKLIDESRNALFAISEFNNNHQTKDYQYISKSQFIKELESIKQKLKELQ